jgi:hypothetical protein
MFEEKKIRLFCSRRPEVIKKFRATNISGLDTS